MAVDLEDKQVDSGSDTSNPGQEHTNSVFNDLTSREHMARDGVSGNPGQDHADSVFNDLTSREHQAKDGAPGSLYNPSGDSPGAAKDSSKDGAGAASPGANALAQAAGPAGAGGKIAAFLWSSSRRKKATVGGGITALLITLGFIGVSVVSGPLEFIHISQLLTSSHFSHQNDAGDQRLGGLVRFMRSGDIGETRLSYVQSKFFKDPTLAKLKTLGFTLDIDKTTGINKGVLVTTTEEGSPYHGKTEAYIEADLNEKWSKYGTVSKTPEGKWYITDDTKTGRLAPRIVREGGWSTISTVVRARILAKFTLASYHPLKILDRLTGKKSATLYDAWSKARQERLKSGVSGANVNGTAAAEQGEPDANGNKPKPVDEPGTAGVPTAEENSSTLKSLANSKGGKITGGVAAAVGLVCVARTVDDHIGDIRYAQVIAPLTRMGMDAITVGQQVMADNDVDEQELSDLHKQFTAVDSAGKTSNWEDAAAIKASQGETGGTPMSSQTQDLLSQGAPSWLDWTQNPAVSGLCSGIGTVVTGTVSVVVGIFSGGLISTVGGLVAGAIGTPLVVDKLSSTLAGDAVNTDVAGAAWGNAIDYGARLGANASALPLGGVALSDQQVAELDAQTNAASKASFDSKSFIARTFDPFDYRTLAAKVIDNANPTPQNVASIIRSGFTNIGSSLLNMPLKLLSSTTRADPQPYKYPFPEYGFSQEDLNNPLVADPYANADAVAQVLDKNGQAGTPDYIAKALKCFAVTIIKGDQGWDVIPADQSPGVEGGFNPYDSKYSNDDCIDTNDTTWLRIRFFILDTGAMEGMGCYLGDDRSCSNDGFASAASTTDTTSTNVPTGPTATSQQVLDSCKNGTAVGKVKIVCSSLSLFGLPYADPAHPFTDYLKSQPKSVGCNAFVDISILRATNSHYKGEYCSQEFATAGVANGDFKKIPLSSVQPGDIVVRESSCGCTSSCGNSGHDSLGRFGHVAVVVSYDPSTDKIVVTEASSSSKPSGISDATTATWSSKNIWGFTYGMQYTGGGL